MSKNIIIAILVIVILGGAAFWFAQGTDTGIVVTQNPAPVEHTPVTPAPADDKQAFGKEVTLKLNDKVTFTNGLVAILTAIDDSRCPAKVECFWQGELGATLELSGGSLSNPGEIHLGTVNSKTVTVESYTITLKDASTTSATILVVKK